MKLAIIQYEWWGNAHIQNRLYVAYDAKTLEVIDYYDKYTLLENCVKEGYSCMILKHHRDNTITIDHSSIEIRQFIKKRKKISNDEFHKIKDIILKI